MSDKRYSTKLWRDVRAVVLARDGYRCRILDVRCQMEATNVDHIVPPKQGGAFFDTANLRAACEWCNKSRGGREGARVVNARRAGYPPALEW